MSKGTDRDIAVLMESAISDTAALVDAIATNLLSHELVLYKAAQRSGNDANYWDVGTTGNQLQANTEYIVKFMTNDSFTLDIIQIGTSASAAGMVDTIASAVSFSSGVEYSVRYTPSVSNLRWIRVLGAAAKFTSIGFYVEV